MKGEVMDENYEKLKWALESKGILVTSCDDCGIAFEIDGVWFPV